MYNESSSDLNTVSSVGLVLKSLLTAVKVEIPLAKWVYDEKLSYESALGKLRANNTQDLSTGTYPLFAFRRSALRHAKDSPGKRAITATTKNKISPTDSRVYRILYGEFDVEFMYITNSMQDLERFEITFLSEEGISGTKEIEVDLGDLGIFKYFVDYSNLVLSEKLVESDNVYYKAVKGQMTVRGFYFVLIGESKHILEIILKIKEFNENLLGMRIIT